MGFQNYPEVTGQVRCFHITNEPDDFTSPSKKRMPKFTPEDLVIQFLEEVNIPDKPAGTQSEEEAKPRLPKLEAICIGTHRSIIDNENNIIYLKPETFAVEDIYGEVERLGHGAFLTRFPDFYGWNYDDEGDIWSDRYYPAYKLVFVSQAIGLTRTGQLLVAGTSGNRLAFPLMYVMGGGGRLGIGELEL